jgi:CheY-like chemotaxis protein/HPt (histidine-containing phosphotransfer) domain-containing protein
MKNKLYYAAALLLVLLPSTGSAQVAENVETNISAAASEVSVAEAVDETAEKSVSGEVETEVSDVNAAEAVVEGTMPSVQEAETEAPSATAASEAGTAPGVPVETNMSIETATTTVVPDKGQSVVDEGVIEEISKPTAETAKQESGPSDESEKAESKAPVSSEERAPDTADKSGSVTELFESVKVKEEVAPAALKKTSKPEKTVTKKSIGGERYIVVGTYSTKANADSELEGLVASFEKLPKIVQKQREHGFGYSSKSSGRFFIATIGPFASSDVLHSVLAETRKLFPDAYVLRLNGKGAATAKKAPKTTVTAARKTEEVKERKAVLEQKSAPVEKHAPEKSTVEPEVATVIGESVAALEEMEIEEEAGGAMPKPESGLSEKSMLLGVAALFALLFVLLFFAARRKPKAKIKTEAEEEGAEVAEVSAEAPAEEKAPSVEAVIKEEEVKPAVSVAEKIEEPVAPPVETVAPAARVRKKREPRSDRGKIAKEDFAEFSGARILVAEDNMINQKVILGLLGESGMDVTIANDGQEALDILEADSDYQLVLMDAHMPRVDGFEATRKIRANPKFDHIAVAALSGDTSTDDLRKMQEAGMEEQLEKPLKMDALYDVLYSYVMVPSEEVKPQAQKGVGLNRAAGLEITGGDEELYNEVLAEFVSMYGKSDVELTKLFSVSDLAQAKALLLDIKSLAANIGAEALSDTAEELREAIINGEEGRFGTLLGMFKTELHAVLDAI